MEDLDKKITFILEIDKLKSIHRKTLVKCHNNRAENSAEHSWQISLLAYLFHDYADEPVNINRVVQMLLIHDIVEIDAGDTFAFDNKDILDAQHEKEQKAANRIFGLLPDELSQSMLDLWSEFEAGKTADARFALAIDRIMPLLQNMTNNGGSWAQHKVSRQQVLERNIYLKDIAPKLWDYANQQIELATKNGWLSE